MIRQQPHRTDGSGEPGWTDRYVWEFDVDDVDDIDDTGADAAALGGKAAQLARISEVDDVRVPAWFCVTTAAYRRTMAEVPSFDALLDQLAELGAGDRAAMSELVERIRAAIEGAGVPADVTDAVTAGVVRLGEESPFAVRSSATAEDLPSTSFAGQHDSALNVIGLPSIIRNVSRCWASLFTDRAVAYRMRNDIDHREVEMAVVVQQMVAAHAAGVLFTADPVTGNRNVASLEAVFGLGEALVSGTVHADVYRVRDAEIVDRKVAGKAIALHVSPGGGTRVDTVEPSVQDEPVLSDEQVLELTALGRRIESHLGCPQDIEWCLDGEGVHVVQSRPITTLFPIPANDEGGNRVYISVGHGQMMTDPMTPLGISVWQMTSPAPMRTAGGRLFVDVTDRLASPATRAATLEIIGRSDPLIRDALETVIARGDFLPSAVDNGGDSAPDKGGPSEPIEPDPSIVAELMERNRASVAELQREIQTRSGPALIDFIVDDFVELRALLFDPRSRPALMAGFEAMWWLNDNMAAWLGERNAADVLSLAAPNNVTAEMGLALLDVADAIRPYPEVVTFLRAAHDDEFLDELIDVNGGGPARDAIVTYLDTYGMRCIGEIDIARPRWREQPSTLLPLIVSNIDNFQPGERERRLDEGRRQAQQKERELLARVRELPDGAEKAEQTKRMIDRLRTFVGYREYPKYGMISRYFFYRQALLAEAERLVGEGALRRVDDIYFLTFDELGDVVRSRHADHGLIARRRDDFRSFANLMPPRVLTSEGEALNGTYRRDDVPAGALVGLAVSGGIVEGRARVAFDMTDAEVELGDILVTPHTDPSWSPIFVTIAGLVTEVGGLTTHGSVIAREYGLTAVVGVERATERIRDGQRIRVDGARGVVEILADPLDAPP